MGYDNSSLFDADDPRWSGEVHPLRGRCATRGCQETPENADDMFCYVCRCRELETAGKKPMAGIAPHEKKSTA